MPKTAGVLLIITGAIQIMFAMFALLILASGSNDPLAGAFSAELALIFGPLIISGIVTVIGGTNALKRKCWRLVLASSIVAFLPCAYWLSFVFFLGTTMLRGSIDSLSLPLFFGALFAFFLAIGIAAIVLTGLSRKKFE